MIKRLPAFLIAGLLVIFCALATTRHHQSYYPVVEVEVPDSSSAPSTSLTLSYLFHSLPTLQSCEALTGNMHWAAHLAVYALIAFAFCLGWPKCSPVQIVAFVAAIGIVHETIEIFSHSHVFETEDAFINAIGALIGVTIQQITKRPIAS